MKKLMLSMVLVAGLSLAANAQTEKNRKFSIGAELGLPKGGDGSVTGISFQFEHPIVKSLNITASAGYLFYRAKRELSPMDKAFGFSDKIKVEFVTLKAGLKYYFGKHFYAAGELGGAFDDRQAGSGAYFAVAPGLGTSFAVAKNANLDLGIRYENWSDDYISLNIFALRAAYSFGF